MAWYEKSLPWQVYGGDFRKNFALQCGQIERTWEREASSVTTVQRIEEPEPRLWRGLSDFGLFHPL